MEEADELTGDSTALLFQFVTRFSVITTEKYLASTSDINQ